MTDKETLSVSTALGGYDLNLNVSNDFYRILNQVDAVTGTFNHFSHQCLPFILILGSGNEQEAKETAYFWL
jgi:hypothetical protein